MITRDDKCSTMGSTWLLWIIRRVHNVVSEGQDRLPSRVRSGMSISWPSESWERGRAGVFHTKIVASLEARKQGNCEGVSVESQSVSGQKQG